MSVRKRLIIPPDERIFNNRNRSPLKERPQHVVSALNYIINERYPPRPISKQPGLPELRKREKGNRLYTSPPQSYSCNDKITLAAIVQHARPGEFIYYKSGSIDAIVYQVVNNNGTKEKRIIREWIYNKHKPLNYPFKVREENASNVPNASNASTAAMPGGRRRLTRKIRRQR
jgi:hypothetical protein